MKYKTQRVADLLGISAESLKNYERAGIIKPIRDMDSGYRQYSYLDICALIRVKMYRQFGFSLKDTKTLINETGLDKTVEILESRKQGLASEMHVLSKTHQNLESLIDEIREVPQQCGRVTIKSRPAFYRIEFSKNGMIYSNTQVVSAVREWMEFSPFARFSSRYHGADVYGGLRIDACYSELFNLNEDSLIRYYPEALCVSLVVNEGEVEFSDPGCQNQLKQFVEEHNFTLADDPLGYTIIGLNKNTDYHRYREISAEIRY